ncbi:MAG TPA: hypothetical protein VFR78_11490 [Pyrinomonadaceae bacterium]|nr:hypothetical protein [Pyrinomonadaceae bacterium]
MKRGKDNDLDEHDAELLLRAVTRGTADHLKCDYDRYMLALYLGYLVDQPKRQRKALKDRLVTQLRLASESKAENNDEFIREAAIEAQGFLDTIEMLRARVGPDESELGRKLHGGDLGDADSRAEYQELSAPEEAFYEVLLKIDQMPVEQRKNLMHSDAFKLLKDAIEQAYESRRAANDWPDIIADQS